MVGDEWRKFSRPWDNGQLGGHIIEVGRLPFFGYCTDSHQLSYPLMTMRSSNKNMNRTEDEGITIGKIARTGGTLPLLPFIRPDNGKKERAARFEWTAIGRDDQLHDFYQVFRSGSNTCLPGPTAGRVTMALLSIPPDQNLQVRTHLSELTELCQLQKSGSNNRQLRRALARLQNLTIETNALWYHGDQKYLGDVSTKLFSSYSLSSSSSKTEIEVQWAPKVAELISSWSKPVHLDRLFRLDSCLPRRLYQICSLGIYQQGEMIEDLKLLCHGHLGISQNRQYPSQLKRSLKKPIEALREKNLIDVTIEKDTESPSIKSDWLVRARPMKGMLEFYKEIPDPQYWAFHLAGRGMMGSKMMGPEDDPLAECRKWVVKKGLSKARRAVEEWDRRHGNGDGPAIRPPHQQHPNGQHASWRAALREDVSSRDASFSESPSTKGGPSTGRDSSSGGGAECPEETSTTDVQPQKSLSALETRERSVEEKISIYLRLIDRDEHSDLYRRASSFIDENYSVGEGARRRVLIREAVGRIFLEKKGAGALPDPLSDQLE